MQEAASGRPCCVLCREFKRLRDQESSRWCGQPVLSERYLLMSLLGKGGLSEVFKVGWGHLNLVGVCWRLTHKRHLLMSLLGKTGFSEVVMVHSGPSVACLCCARGFLMSSAAKVERG